MSSSLTPYRSPALIEKDKELIDLQPKVGFLLAKLRKSHQCQTPGFWFWVWRMLAFRPILHDSVFRCSCNQVFKYDTQWISEEHRWRKTVIADWIQAGGQE